MRTQWILANEAAAILSERSGHTVSADYVRILARDKRIRTQKRDGRTNEYNKSDVEKITVEAYSKGEVQA